MARLRIFVVPMRRVPAAAMGPPENVLGRMRDAWMSIEKRNDGPLHFLLNPYATLRRPYLDVVAQKKDVSVVLKNSFAVVGTDPKEYRVDLFRCAGRQENQESLYGPSRIRIERITARKFEPFPGISKHIWKNAHHDWHGDAKNEAVAFIRV
jgi:hypothetical protein